MNTEARNDPNTQIYSARPSTVPLVPLIPDMPASDSAKNKDRDGTKGVTVGTSSRCGIGTVAVVEAPVPPGNAAAIEIEAGVEKEETEMNDAGEAVAGIKDHVARIKRTRGMKRFVAKTNKTRGMIAAGNRDCVARTKKIRIVLAIAGKRRLMVRSNKTRGMMAAIAGNRRPVKGATGDGIVAAEVVATAVV
ncbi:hypothetical protein BGZ58_006580, partial [Dissophora ornata]